MLATILKCAVPLPKLTDLDDFLFVGPHPDDIEVSCGSTVAKLVQMGKKVTFLIVTNGCVGSIDESITSEQLVEIRKKESISSARLLGVTDVKFLPYNDGDDYDKNAVLKSIVENILEVKPQVVLCPDFTVASECHPDHLNVGKITTDAVFYATWDKLSERLGLQGSVKNITIAYYYTDKPNSYVKVNKNQVRMHMDALRCHKSQFTDNDIKMFQTYFTVREVCFGLRKLRGRSQGFRVLGPTHQHCLPEASKF